MSAASTGAVRLLAPCKLNPTLAVIERRADGFHELALTYLALDLCDRLELTRVDARAGQLRVAGALSGEQIPSDGRNLACRAVQGVLALAREAGRATSADDFDIELSKSVPSQAGLGGGSSDAAAAALGTAHCTGLEAADPRLLDALSAIGSDCAFFLAARDTGHARGRGRGERIEVLPAVRAELFVVLIAPQVGAATQAVYAALSGLGSPAPRRARAERAEQAWLDATTIEDLRGALLNDLEAAALGALPELARWRELFDRHDCEHFRLAGSGSSFFGLYDQAREAETVLARLSAAAASAGLVPRGAWVARPAGHGARRLP